MQPSPLPASIPVKFQSILLLHVTSPRCLQILQVFLKAGEEGTCCLSSHVLELVRCEGSRLWVPGHANSHAGSDQASPKHKILSPMQAIVGCLETCVKYRVNRSDNAPEYFPSLLWFTDQGPPHLKEVCLYIIASADKLSAEKSRFFMNSYELLAATGPLLKSPMA